MDILLVFYLAVALESFVGAYVLRVAWLPDEEEIFGEEGVLALPAPRSQIAR